MRKDYYVYILADRPNGKIYVGVTNDLFRRVSEHRNGLVEGHTKKYRINRLVYFEHTDYINNAISREKRIKSMSRAEKLALIEADNPSWRDMYEDIRHW